MFQYENRRILVVDDEPQMLELLRAYLEKSQFIVDEATNGVEVLLKLKENNYDCIVLDVMMPEMDGLSTCLEVRKLYDVPIIMLTARGDELDRIHGLELGADDYIVKPFSPRELVARIKALFRRSERKVKIVENESNIEQYGGVRIYQKGRKVEIDGKKVVLTPKEYELLFFLTKNANQVWTREQILAQVWGYDFYGSLRTVDTHIKTLRMKLGKYANYIATIWGIGYKFEVSLNETRHQF